jgi:hypothetical protein
MEENGMARVTHVTTFKLQSNFLEALEGIKRYKKLMESKGGEVAFSWVVEGGEQSGTGVIFVTFPNGVAFGKLVDDESQEMQDTKLVALQSGVVLSTALLQEVPL